MPNEHFYACVLAGGSGERFWPMSRARRPKQLLQLLSERTLLEETVRRLDGVVPFGNVFVLTNEVQLDATRAALPMLDPRQIVAEPAKRDTAPAAALATALVRARDPKAVMALLSSDAVIKDHAHFSRQLAAALSAAASRNSLITFGIKPSYPATHFGYLKLEPRLGEKPGDTPIRRVVRFVEKPDRAAAEGYVADGNYAWNAGIFVWRVETFLAEAERNAPELARFVREFPSGSFAAYLAARFPSLPKISLDYAIMEKAQAVETLVAEFDWDDVGSWTALPRHLSADSNGNTVRGGAAVVDSSNNIVIGNGRVIALCGVKDLVVVETPDAVLVCHRDAVEAIKKLHPLLPKDVL